MRARNLVFFGVMALAFVLVCENCFASGEDFQYWSKGGISFDINKEWGFNFEEEFRLGDDAGELYYHSLEPGFIYRGFGKGLDLGFNYKQVYEKDSSGQWREEHQPNVHFTVKDKLFGLDMSDRSRIEYRDRENRKDAWRYRNKLTLKLPVEFTALKLQPYAADEVFFTVTDDNIDKNRLYGGFYFTLSKNVKGEIYYLWQTSRTNDKWTGINVVGTALKFSF